MRRQQGEALVIDHVEVRALPHGDTTTIVEPEIVGSVGRQHLNGPRQVNTLLAAVPGPVGQEIGRKTCVADRADVRATVRQPEQRVRVREHRVHVVVAEFGVIVDREVNQLTAVEFQANVIEFLHDRYALTLCFGAQ